MSAVLCVDLSKLLFSPPPLCRFSALFVSSALLDADSHSSDENSVCWYEQQSCEWERKRAKARRRKEQKVEEREPVSDERKEKPSLSPSALLCKTPPRLEGDNSDALFSNFAECVCVYV